MTLIEADDTHVVATVAGGAPYRVELTRTTDGVRHTCTCPIGDTFCKHSVAVALVAGRHVQADTPEIHLRDHLETLERAELVDLVLEAAARDEYLARRLVVDASAADGATDLSVVRSTIDVSFDTGDFVPYREAYDFTVGAGRAIDILESAISGMRTLDAVDAVEYGLAAWERALDQIDDSSGYFGSLRERLIDLHITACEQAGLGGADLANRLLDWALSSDWEVFLDMAETHGDLLAGDGYARLRERITKAGLGGNTDNAFTLRYLLQSIAHQEGDVDALVDALATDLTYPYHYVQIAEALRDADRLEDAMAWIRRGLQDHPDRWDRRVVDLGVELLFQQGNPQGAWDLAWAEFVHTPSAATYGRLPNLGAGQWAETRPSALDIFRSHLDANDDPRSGGYGPLVTAMLAEGDHDAAWEAAEQGACPAHLWRTLANQTTITHPDKAAPVLVSQLDPIIAGKNKQAYAEAVDVMRTIADCLQRSDRADEFLDVITEVRTNHKPKRNLMALLGAEGW